MIEGQAERVIEEELQPFPERDALVAVGIARAGVSRAATTFWREICSNVSRYLRKARSERVSILFDRRSTIKATCDFSWLPFMVERFPSYPMKRRYLSHE